MYTAKASHNVIYLYHLAYKQGLDSTFVEILRANQEGIINEDKKRQVSSHSQSFSENEATEIKTWQKVIL